MEEDTGKSLHVGGPTGRIHGAEYSLLDYNRAGVPLVEIVTKPIVGTKASAPEVARAYVAALRDLLQSLGVSDVRMDQGSLRCDANLSLTPAGNRDVRHPHRDQERQLAARRSNAPSATRSAGRPACCSAGGRITQETRHFDEAVGTTSPGRSKETAEDYRYFPEPDLVPLEPPRDWVEEIRAPPCPSSPGCAARAAADSTGASPTRRCATWSPPTRSTWSPPPSPPAHRRRGALRGGRPTSASRPTRRASPCPSCRSRRRSSPGHRLVEDGTLNNKLARQVVDGVLAGEGEPDEWSPGAGLAVVSDDERSAAAVDEALAAQPAVADKIRAGKVQAVGAIVGAVMKATRQADAAPGPGAGARACVSDRIPSGQTLRDLPVTRRCLRWGFRKQARSGFGRRARRSSTWTVRFIPSQMNYPGGSNRVHTVPAEANTVGKIAGRGALTAPPRSR